jgi:tetratricopeptide (TPR) repeat protein
VTGAGAHASPLGYRIQSATRLVQLSKVTLLWKLVRERPGGLAALSLMIGVVLFLAWEIVARTMAAGYEDADPERALTWNPHDAAALIVLAERRLAVPEPAADNAPAQNGGPLSPQQRPSKEGLAEARGLAEQALRFDPLAPGALTFMGRIAEIDGDAPRAVALMELAGERALRDIFAQAWLVNHALKRGDFATALTHLDAILSTHGIVEQALPLLAAFISHPQTMAPLVRLVGTDPSWRSQFLNVVASKVADRAVLGRFYAALQAGPHPPSQQELQPYIDRLVNDGLFKEAYAAWAETLPPDRRADPATLYNGAFQYPLSGSEFDWKIVQSLGADVDVAGGEAAVARTLRVEFSGARVDFHNVSHLMALQPGAYRLTGQVEAEALHTERGLWWRVFCVDRPDPSLGETELVAGSIPWRTFSLSFSVPATACGAQVLQLELPARVALERVIDGTVSYRNLAVVSLQTGVENGAAGQRH